jgi:hypothetical protein
MDDVLRAIGFSSGGSAPLLGLPPRLQGMTSKSRALPLIATLWPGGLATATD